MECTGTAQSPRRSSRVFFAAVDRYEAGIRSRARSPVVGLEGDVLDQLTSDGQLETCGDGLAAPLQESYPLPELSADHRTVPLCFSTWIAPCRPWYIPLDSRGQ